MPEDISRYAVDFHIEAFSLADAQQQKEEAAKAFRVVKGSRIALISEAGDYDDYDHDEAVKNGTVLSFIESELTLTEERVEQLEDALEAVGQMVDDPEALKIIGDVLKGEAE